MTHLASATTGQKALLPSPTGLGGSPTEIAAVASGPASGAGIGAGVSSLARHADESLIPLVPSSAAPPAASLSQSVAPVLSSSLSSGEAPRSPSKAVSDSPPSSSSNDPSSSLITFQMRITRIFQRFLVRCPHTFIAIAGVFFPLYYGLGKESLAYSAATFVGVGGTVYCLTRAIFLEVIPHWMLPRNDDTRKWRHLMNGTYTAFITVMFTSAVWKLPDLSATQGLFFLTVSFGAPYVLLAKLYPDIDKQPSFYQLKYDN